MNCHICSLLYLGPRQQNDSTSISSPLLPTLNIQLEFNMPVSIIANPKPSCGSPCWLVPDHHSSYWGIQTKVSLFPIVINKDEAKHRPYSLFCYGRGGRFELDGSGGSASNWSCSCLFKSTWIFTMFCFNSRTWLSAMNNRIFFWRPTHSWEVVFLLMSRTAQKNALTSAADKYLNSPGGFPTVGI